MDSRNYQVVDVTLDINSWFNKDPVRPELDPAFRASNGRYVFALKSNEDGLFKAFCCFARCSKIPHSIKELAEFTDDNSSYVVPYTIWSYDKGCGRRLLYALLDMAREDNSIEGFVTLSPNKDAAKKFHLSNGAKLYYSGKDFVNYKYF